MGLVRQADDVPKEPHPFLKEVKMRPYFKSATTGPT